MFTISAANSDQYIASRTLYGMAMDGNAPASSATAPSAVSPRRLCLHWMLHGPRLPCRCRVGSTVFNYFVNSVSVFGGLAWISILASHIGFTRGMKAQGIPRSSLPYTSSLEPYLVHRPPPHCIIIFFKGFDSFMPMSAFGTTGYKTFITHYIGIPVYVIGYVGFKLIRKRATFVSTRWTSTRVPASSTTSRTTTRRTSATSSCRL
jgi:amino acid transporter